MFLELCLTCLNDESDIARIERKVSHCYEVSLFYPVEKIVGMYWGLSPVDVASAKHYTWTEVTHKWFREINSKNFLSKIQRFAKRQRIEVLFIHSCN